MLTLFYSLTSHPVHMSLNIRYLLKLQKNLRTLFIVHLYLYVEYSKMITQYITIHRDYIFSKLEIKKGKKDTFNIIQ